MLTVIYHLGATMAFTVIAIGAIDDAAEDGWDASNTIAALACLGLLIIGVLAQ